MNAYRCFFMKKLQFWFFQKKFKMILVWFFSSIHKWNQEIGLVLENNNNYGSSSQNQIQLQSSSQTGTSN